MHVNEPVVQLQYSEFMQRQELCSLVCLGAVELWPLVCCGVVKKIIFWVNFRIFFGEKIKKMFYICYLYGLNSNWVVYALLNDVAHFINTI